MLDLANLEQKINTLTTNLNEFLNKLYQLYYSSTPQDVEIEKLNDDGSTDTYTIPNYAKIVDMFNSLLDKAFNNLPVFNILDTARLSEEDESYIETDTTVVYVDMSQSQFTDIPTFVFTPSGLQTTTTRNMIIPSGIRECVISFSSAGQKYKIKSSKELKIFLPYVAWILIKPLVSIKVATNNSSADLGISVHGLKCPTSDVATLYANQWNIVTIQFDSSTFVNSKTIDFTLEWQTSLSTQVEIVLPTVQNNFVPIYRPHMILA